MDINAARMLDANANRAREALRVMEDYARFALNDETLSAELKTIRHTLAAALESTRMAAGGGGGGVSVGDAILTRDTPNDVGTAIKMDRELTRPDLAAVITAAGKRLSEALRVIEEILKTVSPVAAAQVEAARYRGYAAEQTLARATAQAGRFSSVRVYVLLTESLCKLPWEQTLDAIVRSTAFGLPAGDGAAESAPPTLCVQLREKSLPDAELLRRAKVLVARCRAHNALAVINDRPDIALLAGADGIHLGQTDLPCAEARKILGPGPIVGVSTERLDQARQAVRDGATYVGVGPMFPTTTKEKPRLAGPPYAAEAVANLPIPAVAIGGITRENLPQLTAVGVRCVAVCSAVISSDDPGARCREFLDAL